MYMKLKELTDLADKIKQEFPEEGKDLWESIDLVTSAVDAIYDSMTEKVTELMKDLELDRVSSYVEYSKSLLDLRTILLECSGLLENETELEEEIATIDEDEAKERTYIPNYEAYQVDSTIEHSLYENFTHKKACAFRFCGEYVEVVNMKWVLVETCGLLAKINLKKMESFLNDKSMKGRKVSYFDSKCVIENNITKNERIPGTDIYVWTSSSCNMTRNLLKKLLKKYNIGLNQFKIYLRADYADLHLKPNAQENSPVLENIKEEIPQPKIGKYVQSCFEHLEKVNYRFTDESLEQMQSSEWTLKTFGIGKPLLRKYDPTKTMAEQIKIGPYNRYWKQPYLLGDVQYFLICEWLSNHQERFEHWYTSLNIERRTGEKL